MQEVSRREAREIFGSSELVYFQGDYIRDLGVDRDVWGFKRWVTRFHRVGAQSKNASIKIVEKLGDIIDTRDKTSVEHTLNSMAETYFYNGRENDLINGMRCFLEDYYEDWKNSSTTTMGRAFGVYPSKKIAFQHVQISVEKLPETMIIPDQDHILGVGSYLKKDVEGAERLYKITGTKLGTHDPQKIDILYTLKRQLKLYGQYQDDTMALEINVMASDLGKSYEVQFLVPYSSETKQSRKHVLGNLVVS